ncbi:cytochrome P450 [Aspergillus cavernicola]|uniref:Cytochrome P450 n=1 Tax=Aspergillus cavernicola TaxID=176166 RepID=A0ABR4HWK3_9EURO
MLQSQLQLHLQSTSLLTQLGLLVAFSLALCLTWTAFTILSPYLRVQGKKILNDRARSELLWTNARQRFQAGARELFKAAFAQHPNAFYIMTDTDVELILNPKYAPEVRNDKRFDIGKYNEQMFHGTIAGFEMFEDDHVLERVFVETVRNKLTRAIGKFVEPISQEAADGLQKQWTDNTEWHALPLHQSILRTIAQQSSRVFQGPPLCRNPDWLRITVNHTVTFFEAAESLKVWPHPLRPLAAKFLPLCRKLRSEAEEARSIIAPVLEERRVRQAQRAQHGPAKEAGEKGEEVEETAGDMIEWSEQTANGAIYDPALLQMKVSLASIHTTSDLVSQAIFNLCSRPKLVDDLRKEVISVIGQYGWIKMAIYQLKLMDSVLKETQRLKPISIGTMVRTTTSPVTFSDGLQVPQNTRTLVSCHNMWCDSVHKDASQFDGYRFLKLRQRPGQENWTQLVSTSNNHLGFGHGMHACPGRFFAATTAKVLLAHVVLKYDLKLLEGQKPDVIEHGAAQYANVWCEIGVRRRREEIDLACPLA